MTRHNRDRRCCRVWRYVMVWLSELGSTACRPPTTPSRPGSRPNMTSPSSPGWVICDGCRLVSIIRDTTVYTTGNSGDDWSVYFPRSLSIRDPLGSMKRPGGWEVDKGGWHERRALPCPLPIDPSSSPPSVFPSHEAHPTTPCDHVHFSLPNPNSVSLDLEASTKPQGRRWKKGFALRFSHSQMLRGPVPLCPAICPFRELNTAALPSEHWDKASRRCRRGRRMSQSSPCQQAGRV
ncbi:hypothetical protein B0T18DRAFT_210422 [Schizothecium vesticola]|uniref:Uncharacterized protein n=1 Tax=Schizothecium vesticola TaxID=314040 RepID=A0AA40JZJ2_9PEZI|nr:hypothetical protein B0T18DRAFT_210422 [Schizothecium vesticola]